MLMMQHIQALRDVLIAPLVSSCRTLAPAIGLDLVVTDLWVAQKYSNQFSVDAEQGPDSQVGANKEDGR